MPLFGRRTATTHTTTRTTPRRGLFHRKDRDRVAGGYKAALANPNTTSTGRKRAKRSLRAMGRGGETHVPIMVKIKRTLGIRSSPRKHTTTTRRTRY